MAMDARHRYIARVLTQQYGMSLAAVEEVFLEEKHAQQLANFMTANGVPTLIFFRQRRDIFNEDGEAIEAPAGARH